jgi:hypothetical protein
LCEFVLQVCWIDLVRGVAAVDSPNVVEQGLLEEAKAGAVEGLRVDGIVDDLEADQAHDGGRSGGSGKERGADLPGLGIGA